MQASSAYLLLPTEIYNAVNRVLARPSVGMKCTTCHHSGISKETLFRRWRRDI